MVYKPTHPQNDQLKVETHRSSFFAFYGQFSKAESPRLRACSALRVLHWTCNLIICILLLPFSIQASVRGKSANRISGERHHHLDAEKMHGRRPKDSGLYITKVKYVAFEYLTN
jgi:hypothetical protein